MAGVLTHTEAKVFYDRFGARQDGQAFYEDAASADLVAHARFGEARAVFEFGCGTGRFAAMLLADHLAADCAYIGVDVSATMVGLARARLEAWRDRAEVCPSSGSVNLDAPDGTYDRLVSNFVLDLLSEQIYDSRALLAEARRILAPEGLLCLTGLTFGATPVAGVLTRVWEAVHRVRPALVGGCRPVRVLDFVDTEHWSVRHHAVVTRFAISS